MMQNKSNCKNIHFSNDNVEAFGHLQAKKKMKNNVIHQADTEKVTE